MNRTHADRQTGFSLIELMIAMVMGLILIGGVITVFLGIKRSFELSTTMSALQENGRFVLDRLAREARLAGYQGCLAITQAGVAVSTNNAPTTDLRTTAISGSLVGSGVWTPSAPDGFIIPVNPAPVEGTYALSLQKASQTSFELANSMASEGSNIQVSGANGVFSAGDLAVISNCEHGDLFQINTVSAGSSSVTLGPGQALNSSYRTGVGIADQVRVMRFLANVFFIADTGRENDRGDDIYSLFQQSYPYTAANPAVELIEGVENLQIRFGIRNVDDNTVKYVAADAADFDPGLVNSVQIGLLLSSYEAIAESDDENTYVLAGVLVEPASTGGSGPTHPVDRRARQAFNATVEVRNLRFSEEVR